MHKSHKYLLQEFAVPLTFENNIYTGQVCFPTPALIILFVFPSVSGVGPSDLLPLKLVDQDMNTVELLYHPLKSVQLNGWAANLIYFIDLVEI